MNRRRDVIERFIAQGLSKSVAKELDRGALADQSRAAKKLKEVAEQIAQALGQEALDADGSLAEAYHGTPLGKKYLDPKVKAGDGRSREAVEVRTASWRLARTTCGRHRTHHLGGHTP